ncbi:choice-of-anchor C family protein [Sphingomonas sp. SE220]|uniref:Choice-of-anchor C family protein n=2 Tax=Sphingomonas hankyongi TaxID=2908209 RepID=A0ABT0S2M9_9SPHN|nr:choice-of-anchor C family protein [Sphingomonas hankyongi]MCL6730112.1 choice-of-anchor C family protein [Sphingomonas hankyongi]
MAAALAITASPANAATIINGSFEDGPDPGSFTEHVAGDTSITGWTVSSGTIDYIGSYWETPFGENSIDLAGSSLGSITQELTGLNIGQGYTITFWASKNPDGGSDPRTGLVSVGGQTGAFAYSAFNSLADMQWAPYSFYFVADATSMFLTFAADASAGCCFGPALDNVGIIDAVPEPEVWAMLLLGFFGIGVQMRRRGVLRTVTA